jgi:hypothetical protein
MSVSLPHNDGDGIKMAQLVGADLWHMNDFAGPSMALKVPEYKSTFSMTPLHYTHELPGGMIVVGPDANRFVNEKLKPKHGKIRSNGQWRQMPAPWLAARHCRLTGRGVGKPLRRRC